MSATLTEQVRTFHITGQGLEEQRLELTRASVLGDVALPKEAEFYPVHFGPDGAVIPNGGLVVPFGPEAALALVTAAVVHVRDAKRLALREHVRHAAERLHDLLRLDASHAADAVTEGSVASALGDRAGTFLKADSLAGVLRRRANPVERMEAGRRERCQSVLKILREGEASLAQQPRLHLFFAGSAPGNLFGGLLHEVPDPCAAALRVARAQLRGAEALLRALRMAKLEMEGAYEPDVHGPVLERFRWEAAEPEEIAALAPVVVSLSEEEAEKIPLGSYAHLLRSGCPVTVVVAKPLLAERDLTGDVTDFAAVGLAQSEAFVLQGSLAHAPVLQAGLEAMAKTLRPAMAVIAVPGAGGWAEAALLPLVKAWPLYSFDPLKSEVWRECFAVEKLPECALTPAHAAALNPELAGHFRRLPEGEDARDPMELGAYLAQFHAVAPRAIPVLELPDAAGGVQRVALSRDVAEYCHERKAAAERLDEWTKAPEVAVVAPVVEDREVLLKEGAELAVARVLALLGGAKS